jgi:hypothetical protein
LADTQEVPFHSHELPLAVYVVDTPGSGKLSNAILSPHFIQTKDFEIIF